jgi:hypothetical protein
VQLGHTYDLDEMYGDNYGYRSGLNGSMVRHLKQKVAALTALRPVGEGDVVLDIGSNDGTTLSFYPASCQRIGIDPTSNKFRAFHPPGITAIADFFTAASFTAASAKKASIVTSISMFYDLPAPLRFVQDVASILADDGVWHLEQSYLPLMLETNSYDTVCHEHLEYYSLGVLAWMFERAGLCIAEVQFNDVNGGSFAVTVKKGSVHAPAVAGLLAAEKPLDSLDTWAAFRTRVEAHRRELPALLRSLKAQGKKVLGLGASTKGNVVLQYCGITADLLPAIAEVNPDKYGAFTPGTELPICSEQDAAAMSPDVYLVLPWHFRATFLERQKAFMAAGGQLLFPLPKLELVPQK